MRRIAFIAATMLAAPASADDYPFTGYFASVDADASIEDAQRTCALSFFRQEANGDFVNYLIDRPAFVKDGTVRYDLDGNGICSLSDGKLEECKVLTAVHPDEPGMEFASVFTAIDEQGVRVAGFFSAADARSWMQNHVPDPDYLVRYERCVGFDEAKLRSRFTGEPTAATPEENDQLGSTPTDETRLLADAILAKLIDPPNPESE